MFAGTITYAGPSLQRLWHMSLHLYLGLHHLIASRQHLEQPCHLRLTAPPKPVALLPTNSSNYNEESVLTTRIVIQVSLTKTRTGILQ
jgi:hypothetical protein